jgi:glutathione peroxidase
MKTILFSLFSLAILLTSCSTMSKSSTDSNQLKPEGTAEARSIHEFTVKDIDGNDFDLSSLKGKKVMIVNTASKCGLTPQYEQLQSLYDGYKDAQFVVIGFPANNFMSQEPGTDEEIESFCQKNYGVTFPMMSKISVKGNDQHEVYKFLTMKSQNGLEDNDVQWNFQKYLLDEEGKLVRVVSPKILPNDASIISWIEGK